jgi:hypothetical protein
MSNDQIMPTDAKARKDAPMARGLLDYFPLACAAVAELSRIGNEQHNPGEPMHWAREKSTDHADCLVRHLIDRGKIDNDGVRHITKVAWRALALCQLELEAPAAEIALKAARKIATEAALKMAFEKEADAEAALKMAREKERDHCFCQYPSECHRMTLNPAFRCQITGDRAH